MSLEFLSLKSRLNPTFRSSLRSSSIEEKLLGSFLKLM
jgi:hypothetical protein